MIFFPKFGDETVKETCFPKFTIKGKKKPIPKSDASVYHDAVDTLS